MKFKNIHLTSDLNKFKIQNFQHSFVKIVVEMLPDMFVDWCCTIADSSTRLLLSYLIRHNFLHSISK